MYQAADRATANDLDTDTPIHQDLARHLTKAALPRMTPDVPLLLVRKIGEAPWGLEAWPCNAEALQAHGLWDRDWRLQPDPNRPPRPFVLAPIFITA